MRKNFIAACLLLFTCWHNSIAQNKLLPDSICMLQLVENQAFAAFANSRIQPPVNALTASAENEVLYLVYNKQTGAYRGLSLLLDNVGQVTKAYRFESNRRKNIKSLEESWKDDSLNLRSLFFDSACFMNNYYKSEGTDELLVCRKKGVPVSGLIYKGCSTNDHEKETSVYNRTWLALLEQLRKKL